MINSENPGGVWALARFPALVVALTWSSALAAAVVLAPSQPILGALAVALAIPCLGLALLVRPAVLAIALAWGVGWAITRQAVMPLTQISAAMRRFAQGDFRPEPIRPASDDEIGELAHSYNGALHQVHSAFAQRDRTESEIRQFIADAGHELRTPLTVIMGYLDVLEDGAVDAPGIRERVFATLRQESRRMRTLIEKLIYLAKLERGETTAREIVDVSAVVTRVVSSVTAADAAAPIEVSTVPAMSVPSCNRRHFRPDSRGARTRS